MIHLIDFDEIQTIRWRLQDKGLSLTDINAMSLFDVEQYMMNQQEKNQRMKEEVENKNKMPSMGW